MVKNLKMEKLVLKPNKMKKKKKKNKMKMIEMMMKKKTKRIMKKMIIMMITLSVFLPVRAVPTSPRVPNLKTE